MGPRRTTLTFSSEDAAPLKEAAVFVYYCKYSGKHVLTTDCDLSKAPRRRTDHSLVIDTSKHTVRLYNTTDGGEKLIRRRSGAVERQYRIRVGKLAFAYRSEPEGKYLYILDGAVTTYASGAGPDNLGVKAPVPPCIRAAGDGTAVVLEVDDRSRGLGLLKISADSVRLQIQGPLAASSSTDTILNYMRGVLGTRLSHLSLERGADTRRPRLLVRDLNPDQVFEKLNAELQGRSAEAAAAKVPE